MRFSLIFIFEFLSFAFFTPQRSDDGAVRRERAAAGGVDEVQQRDRRRILVEKELQRRDWRAVNGDGEHGL